MSAASIPKKWFCLIIAIACSITWIIQSQFVINCDLNWDLFATKRLLAGGTYTNDFFDLNPPLIFYLLTPPVLITSFFEIPIRLSFHFYTLIVSVISLSLCNYLLSTIYRNNRSLHYVTITVIAISYFIFPLNDYGEREHFLVIFTMPYLLSIAYRLTGETLGIKLATIIGLFAFAGFALKPYFLLTPLLLEIYYILKTRKLLNALRIENSVLVICLVLYVVFIYIYHNDYISVIVPVARKYYHEGMNDPWKIVLINPWIMYCYYSILCFAATYRKQKFSALNSLLFLAIIGFMIAYLIQIKDWYYHIYPALGVAILLNSLILCESKKNYFVTVVLASLTFAWPLYYFCQEIDLGKLHKENVTIFEKNIKNITNNKTLYTISTSPNYFLPSYYNDITKQNSRFLHLFWLPGTIHQNSDKNALIEWVNEDLIKNKPDFIIVDTADYKMYLYEDRIDLIEYFRKNAVFGEIWKNYHLIKRINISKSNFSNTNDWVLYYYPDKNQIPNNLQGKYKVILTGDDNPKKAYLMQDDQWMKTKRTQHNYAIERTINLSDSDLQWIQKKTGYIKRTADTQDNINQIVYTAIHSPKFDFAIYARNSDNQILDQKT